MTRHLSAVCFSGSMGESAGYLHAFSVPPHPPPSRLFPLHLLNLPFFIPDSLWHDAPTEPGTRARLATDLSPSLPFPSSLLYHKCLITFLHTSSSHSPPVLSSSTSSHMGLIYFCYMISIILWQTPCFASLCFPSLLLNVLTTWSHVSLFKLDSTLFPSQQKWCIMSFFLMAPYGVAQIHFCNLLCLTSVNFSILVFTPKTFRCLEKLVCLISIILSQSFLPMSEFMLLWFNCS